MRRAIWQILSQASRGLFERQPDSQTPFQPTLHVVLPAHGPDRIHLAMSHTGSLEDLTTAALEAERQKQWATATTIYAALRTERPEQELGWLGGARTAFGAGRTEEADALLAEAVKRWPSSYPLASAYAGGAMERGAFELAIARWTDIVAAFPTNPSAVTSLCLALGRTRRYDEAEGRAAEAIERFPSHLPLHVEHARAAEGRRQWDEALRRWQGFDARFPDRSEARVGMVLALREQRRLDEAEAIVKESLRTFPRDRALIEAAALLAQVRRAWPEAIARWDTLLAYYPGHQSAHQGRVLALRESGRLDDAERAITEALALYPASTALLSEQARLAGSRSDWVTAQSSWESVAALMPGSPQPIVETGWALMRQNRYEEAETFLEGKLADFQGRPDIAVCHAQVASRMRRWDEAAARWTALEARFPDDPGVLGGLAEALWALKQEDALVPVLDRLLMRQPDSATGAILYGRLEMRRNQAVAAVARMTAAAARWPNNNGITATLNDARMQALMEAPEEAQAAPARSALAQSQAVEPTSAEAELFAQFESLGSGCEFGLLQRKFGVEPLGLLRWSSIAPGGLIDMLEHRFEHVGNIETTRVEIEANTYILHDDRYRMGMQTFIATTQESAETLLPKLCGRMRYLARELADNLEEANQILVYKAKDPIADADIWRMWRAVRSYGETPLLIVKLCEPNQEAGHVDVLEDGLMIGWIDRFSNYDISVAAWESVCLQARQIWLDVRQHSKMTSLQNAWL